MIATGWIFLASSSESDEVLPLFHRFSEKTFFIVRTIRRTRVKVFLEGISQILQQLEPTSYFNPVELWKNQKLAEQEAKENEEQAAAAGPAKGKKPKKEPVKSKAEQIKEQNKLAKLKERFENEVLLIRNSKKELLSLIRSLKYNDSRFILLVQLLKGAMTDYKNTGAKRGLYEVLWAIDDLAKTCAFPTTAAPKPTKASLLFEKDSSLVFDSLDEVKKLLKEARDVMDNESDIIRTQLTEMSDCLPPLSKLNFGFKLDEWQKQALRWIDNNESVVICAPTSSGKTVLSAYVAVIFKADIGAKREDEEEDAKAAAGNAKGGSAKGKPAAIKDAPAARKPPTLEDDEDEEIDEEDWGPEEEEEWTEADRNAQRRLEEQVDALDLGDMADNLARLIDKDRQKRETFRSLKKTLPSDFEFASNSGKKVLFVVPTEPLVWQVAAYFTKMLREEGDRATRVAIVTDPLVFSPAKKLGVMPQIVVGTPFALESALTKPRGIFGRWEVSKKAAGDILAGGFDHFDWVIYDEVHALDGDEGAALQRLIRSMQCPFLALSATVGNAEQLKGWMEVVRGDQRNSQINALTVSDSAATADVANVRPENPEGSGVEKKNVNLLVRQVRFINLQRYAWDSESAEVAPAEPATEKAEEGEEEEKKPEKLRLVSPLAAVPSVDDLRNGILSNSSLSFTSNDSYTLWLRLREIFKKSPKVIEHLSPNVFFTKVERITLARTKEYEDLLKQGLQKLAESHPVESQALLDSFKVYTASKEVDLCEIALNLQQKDMLPALAFHLNSFDAIELFQQVLAGLEYRQKLAHPRYYNQMLDDAARRKGVMDKIIQSCGKNEDEIEKKKRAGEIQEIADVDTTAPHPDFCLSKNIPMVDHELDRLLFDMERNDGFEKRDAANSKSRNEVILKNALIRGLRRGVGLFIDEVSFPSYRRAIQKLASTGKLGLVISDGSLAFGVNMPFRTCIFCGEMRGELDELMAQQMSGRAGRRGLDVQGNIVYAGVRPRMISRLMIGSVSNITGEHQLPRYDSLILQSVLSPRHCGFYRSLVLSGTSLKEFCDNTPCDAMANLRRSKEIMTHLRFITEDPETRTIIPDAEAGSNFALLCLIWELRHYPHESATIGMLMSHLIEEFDDFVRTLNLREKRRNQELMDAKLNDFFSILVQLVGRTAWKPSPDPENIPHPPKLHELPYFANDEGRMGLFQRWERLFASVQADIPEEFAHLRDPVTPGTDLDGTFFQCAIDRKFVLTLGEVKKQEIKKQLWHVGNVLKTMNNALILEDTYVMVNYFVFGDAFKKLRYLNSELIHDIVNFDDVSSYDFEKRTDTEKDVIMPKEADLWTDLETVSWHTAIEKVVEKAAPLREKLLHKSKAVVSAAEDDLRDAMFVFTALKDADFDLIRALVTWNLRQEDHAEVVAGAIAKCSFASGRGTRAQDLLGVASWIASAVKKEVRMLPLYARELADLEDQEAGAVIDKVAVAKFNDLSNEEMLLHLPSSYGHQAVTLDNSVINGDKMNVIRENFQKFVDYESESEDEDEEEDEDD